MISSSPEVSSTAQLAQVRTETLYGVKRRMNLRLISSLKEMKTWEVTSWHGYQLAEQIVKIDVGTAWPPAGMRWLAPAKTRFYLGVKKQVRLAPGTTLHGYDLTAIPYSATNNILSRCELFITLLRCNNFSQVFEKDIITVYVTKQKNENHHYFYLPPPFICSSQNACPAYLL